MVPETAILPDYDTLMNEQCVRIVSDVHWHNDNYQLPSRDII